MGDHSFSIVTRPFAPHTYLEQQSRLRYMYMATFAEINPISHRFTILCCVKSHPDDWLVQQMNVRIIIRVCKAKSETAAFFHQEKKNRIPNLFPLMGQASISTFVSPSSIPLLSK